jgi:putative copper export protein
VLSPTAATVRLFLHVIAATVWVGGQLTLAGLVPGLRALSPDAPKAVARRFNRIAWPAYGVLVATGIWNVVAIDIADTTTAYQVTLLVKLLLVALSGVAAFVHSTTADRRVLAIGGAVGGVATLGALFLAVLMRSGA